MPSGNATFRIREGAAAAALVGRRKRAVGQVAERPRLGGAASVIIHGADFYDEVYASFEAIEKHEAALAISREIGDLRGEGIHLGILGIAYTTRGRYAEAIEKYDQEGWKAISNVKLAERWHQEQPEKMHRKADANKEAEIPEVL